jgi:integration host factor subunit beta
MVRSELARLIADENPGFAPRDIEATITTFFGEISRRLESGGRVELRGFGAFSTRARGSRGGRNPRTGSAVEIPSKRVLHFKPGKDMHDRLNA